MTLTEIKQRLKAVLSALDEMSKNGTMEIKGLCAMQEMAGCIGVLSELMSIERIEEQRTDLT